MVFMLQPMEPITLFRRTSVAGDTRRSHSRLTTMILYMRRDHFSLKFTKVSKGSSVEIQSPGIASNEARRDRHFPVVFPVFSAVTHIDIRQWSHSSNQKTIDQTIFIPEEAVSDYARNLLSALLRSNPPSTNIDVPSVYFRWDLLHTVSTTYRPLYSRSWINGKGPAGVICSPVTFLKPDLYCKKDQLSHHEYQIIPHTYSIK